MQKQKRFKMNTGESTMEEILNFGNAKAKSESDSKEMKTNKQAVMEHLLKENTKSIEEMDQATQQAINDKLEKRDKKVLLLIKNSTHEKLKEQAWIKHKSVNAYINEIIEKELIGQENKENE